MVNIHAHLCDYILEIQPRNSITSPKTNMVLTGQSRQGRLCKQPLSSPSSQGPPQSHLL